MNLDPLLSYFATYLPLDAREAALLAGRVTQRPLRRRQLLLQAGFPCQHYSFVLRGCLRLFALDARGAEHNLQFAAEQDWVADISAFHSGRPSQLFIEAIEPATVLQIEQQDLYFLYENIPKLDRIFKVIIENKFVELQNRVLQTISSTAQQRYLAFLAQYPALAARLPGTHIASYLGITPEFLSKIRKDLAAGA